VERYRITLDTGSGVEQTWVLLPDRPSAVMQAEEYANRQKQTHVRVYHEVPEQAPELVLDLPARG
jgi:hypothetical protein